MRFFGSENNNYAVTLELMDANRNSCVVSKARIFSSKWLRFKDTGGYPRGYYGFEVLFDAAADLKRNTKYHIEALISGPPSGYGTDGFSSVHCSGVTFTLSSSDSPRGNGTCQTEGQFPEFLFFNR